MASEDSDQFVSGLAMIHRLRDLSYLDETLSGQMATRVDDLHAPRELLEVVTLRRPERMLTEKRNDRPDQLRAAAHEVLAEMLAVVVMTLVDEDPAYAEEALELFEAAPALLALSHDEPMEHLVAGCVASSFRAVRLTHETNREATFSVYKADHPATELHQAFLLIVRTRHVVTMVNALSDVTR